MPLLEDGRLVPDPWVTVGDEEPVPEGVPALVGLERLLREWEALAGRAAPLGVVLPPEAAVARIAPLLGRLAVVAVRLPKHRDGRAFTQARALREHHGYTGEIRAVGHVLPDQYRSLLRCGVTTVEVPEGADPAVWDAARRVIPIAYQPAVAGADTPLALLRRRLAVA